MAEVATEWNPLLKIASNTVFCCHSIYSHRGRDLQPVVHRLYVCVVISVAVVVPAAEGHREGPHTLDQQRGHAVPQV